MGFKVRRKRDGKELAWDGWGNFFWTDKGGLAVSKRETAQRDGELECEGEEFEVVEVPTDSAQAKQE